MRRKSELNVELLLVEVRCRASTKLAVQIRVDFLNVVPHRKIGITDAVPTTMVGEEVKSLKGVLKALMIHEKPPVAPDVLAERLSHAHLDAFFSSDSMKCGAVAHGKACHVAMSPIGEELREAIRVEVHVVTVATDIFTQPAIHCPLLSG